MAFYLDTSALVRLVAPEPESDALREWLAGRTETLVTSDLARTELFRAVRRARPESVAMARQVLDSLTVLRMETGVFEGLPAWSHPGCARWTRCTWQPRWCSRTTCWAWSPMTIVWPRRRGCSVSRRWPLAALEAAPAWSQHRGCRLPLRLTAPL